MNVKLLRRVKRHILKHPKSFDMEMYAGKKRGCGTVGCIAGWACALRTTGGEPDECANMFSGLDALDLQWEQGSLLFYPECWPVEYLIPFNAAESPAAKAKIAAARIEHFIEKGL